MVSVCAFSAPAQTARRTTAAVNGSPAARAAATSLPIRRVILYSNGVAYIERRGTVTGNAEINLSFKQSQVDDVLKSMVVLDLGKGKIGAVSYNSSAPASVRMSEIPFSVAPVTSDGSGVAGVLAQLQGARVAVSTVRGSQTGAVLTVERKTVRSEKETYTTNVLVIASESGEIVSFDLAEVRGIKLLDEGTRTDVAEFANATASARRLDAKTITITSEGSGPREMLASYTIAAPIWKTTYRVVLDEAGKPFFQGWAIVDNISEEDWNGVQMSLISGSPISFIQNLQKPFYRYRPVVPTPEDLQLRPQVYEEGGGGTGYGMGSGDGDGSGSHAISGVVTDQQGAVVPGASVTLRNESDGQTYAVTTDSSGHFVRGGLPGGSYTVIATAPGFQTLNVRNTPVGRRLKLELPVGSVSATVDVSASSIESLPLNGRQVMSLLNTAPATVSSETFQLDGAQTTMSQALTSGKAGVSAAATGNDIADMFEYRIEQPVTVLRNRSALIPIVQTQMDGERVAVYNEAVRMDRPMSGVLLKNTTGLTLESGSMTVIDGNAYAGEALMERLKDKEERLVSFALDLGTQVRVRPREHREPAALIKASKGVFEVHFFRTEEKVYELANQTARPKTVYIEFPIRYGWELTGESPKPIYATQSFYRFRVELQGHEKKDLTIALKQPLQESYQVGSITRQQLELFLSRRYIGDATRAKLEKLIVIREQIAAVDVRLQGFDNEVESIEADQKRLRGNIESLSKTPEAKTLIARYIAKAGEQETRLEQIAGERKTALAEKERLERELSAEIRNFEVK